MSALSSASLGSVLPATATAPVDPALQPASIRNGNQAAKNAYQTGVAFENVLMNQLAQAMTATIPGGGSDDDGLGGSSSDDSGDSSSDATGGLTGSDSGISAYSSLLPQAMTSGIMSSGGTGIAMQIAQSLDPALANPKAATKS
jgi:hypothetical protein